MTVPHEDFIAKINAVRYAFLELSVNDGVILSTHHAIIIIMIRYAFLELGVEDGVILARTDSLGAGLTQKIPVSKVC